MKFRVKWTGAAETDLEAIIDFIADDNLPAAFKLLEHIKNLTHNLYSFPERGRIVPELKEYNISIYRELIYEHWRIVYKIEDGDVKVIAVFDARRNIEDLLLDRILGTETLTIK